MKKFYSLILFLISNAAFSQVTFWTEDFTTNACGQGTLADGYVTPNGTWTVASTGTNDAQCNNFYISASENGNGAGNCGSGCGTNRTLHIGANDGFVATDGGASYDAGGVCSFGICVNSNWRAQSPVIDCSNYHLMTATFSYMEFGDGTIDDATFWVYDGVSWTQVDALAKTACCGGPCNGSRQGQWTSITVSLPASAEYNPNVKLGFQWTNNDDSNGTDPSFAVDDIVLTGRIVESFVSEINSSNIHVFPNPAADQLTISLSSGHNNQYRILDISGRQVISSALNQQIQKIDITALNSGCYFLQVFNGENDLVSSSRFIKQ